MGSNSGFFKGEKKKLKKEKLEKQAVNIKHAQATPQVKIIGKGKKNKGK